MKIFHLRDFHFNRCLIYALQVFRLCLYFVTSFLIRFASFLIHFEPFLEVTHSIYCHIALPQPKFIRVRAYKWIIFRAISMGQLGLDAVGLSTVKTAPRPLTKKAWFPWVLLHVFGCSRCASCHMIRLRCSGHRIIGLTFASIDTSSLV